MLLPCSLYGIECQVWAFNTGFSPLGALNARKGIVWAFNAHFGPSFTKQGINHYISGKLWKLAFQCR
ncbi:uncharacterized protein DS421_20g686200 [Arachis hypogaea]|nr:uncharacterized protein DS421_20g686200 [Arachis hypogaea]